MFDPSSIRLSKEFKPVIKAAKAAGWEFRHAGNGGVRVLNPKNPDETFYLPITTRRGENIAKAALKMIAGSDLESTDVADIMIGDAETFGEVSHGPSLTIKCRQCETEFVSWEALSMHVATEHTSSLEGEPFADPEPEQPTLDIPEDNPVTPEDNPPSTSGTVFRKPYLAVLNQTANGETQFYNSETTVEVTMEGGEVIGYECAFCGQRFPEAYSVPQHYGAHVRRGEAPAANVERREVAAVGTAPRRYRPKLILQGGLAREIYDAIKAGQRKKDMSDSVYAQVLADRILQARATNTTEVTVPDEALDAELHEVGERTVLDQIRALLGVDADMQERLAQAEARAEAAEAQSKKDKEYVQTLRELLAE